MTAPVITVAEARRYHCARMARTMRVAHREALERLGVDVADQIRLAFDASILRKVILIDGELAVLGGMHGSLLSPRAAIWLCLSQKATRYPLAIIKTLAALIDEVMAGGKRELVTTVLNDDDAGQRFSAFMGFHVSSIGPGQRAYSRAGRRSLIDYMRRDPDCRITAAAGYVIQMGYQHDDRPG